MPAAQSGEEGSVQLQHRRPLAILPTLQTEQLVYSLPVSHRNGSLLACINVQCDCPLRFKIAHICYAQVV